MPWLLRSAFSPCIDKKTWEDRRIRTFIAIELPEKLLGLLAGLRVSLDRGFIRVSWVKTSNMHLTLKFLGEVEESRIEGIVEELSAAARGVKPFTISTGALGGFPNLSAPRVVWLGLKDQGELARLSSDIEDRLEGLNFEREGRPFHPHLTLCRVKSQAEGRTLGALAAGLEGNINMDFRVDSFMLYKSKLGPGGAEHSVIKKMELAGK